MTVNFARRAHDHNFSIDPIIRSLLDTDFYKLLMAQFIWLLFPTTSVTFALKNRTKKVRLADIIPEAELRAQLDHVMGLRFLPNELIWLAGATFYGKQHIFRSGFIDFLRGLRMPSYSLSVEDGQYVLTFSGTWAEITFWEIYALAIISELKTRAGLRQRTERELEILYANAMSKFFKKLKKLKKAGVKGLSEFGTRRRHSFLWQEWVVLTMRDVLGDGFVGTSNAYLAMKHGLEAIGTNAHELPMALAALANSDKELKQSQYEVLRFWQEVYSGNLLIALPDTFGTTQFLRDAPSYLFLNWKGFRPDSKNPMVAGDELITAYKDHAVDPMERNSLFADGLDVKIDGYATHGTDIIEIRDYFQGRIGTRFGWGTNASNDFRECDPRDEGIFDAISLVCKVESANGRGAVKLSDNYEKATGTPEDIDRYFRVFGTDGLDNAPVEV
jgi:nicotinate phosphoribosyltransferase